MGRAGRKIRGELVGEHGLRLWGRLLGCWVHESEPISELFTSQGFFRVLQVSAKSVGRGAEANCTCAPVPSKKWDVIACASQKAIGCAGIGCAGVEAA
jgi:hypothetical protein